MIHPRTLDSCIQPGLVSCHSGKVENAKKAFIPVAAENLSIPVPDTNEENDDGTGWGISSGELVGSRGVYEKIQLCSKSVKLLLQIVEMKCVAYDGVSQAITSTLNSLCEPYWRPVANIDINTLNNKQARAVFVSPNGVSQSQLDNLDRLFCCYSCNYLFIL